MPTSQNDTVLEELLKDIDDKAEEERIKKEYDEYLKACGAGFNAAISDTITEIMEGRKIK